MKTRLYLGTIVAGITFAAMTVPLGYGQLPNAGGATSIETARPRQPGGLLGDPLGTYLTIEGVRLDGLKIESNTLLVDTVNGKKLDKPIAVLIRGASVSNYNLQRADLSLAAQQRCIFKGFESGEMIGVPPAVAAAAKEQGWREAPMSSALWQWRPYFVALVVVKPADTELRKR